MARRSLAAVRGAAAAALITAILGSASPALAAAPTSDTVTLDFTFDDELLSQACGVPVVTTVSGQLTRRTFEDSDKGLQFVLTVNATLVATAGDNTFRFRNVGADQVRITPDGTAVLSIIGQVPFSFNGVMKIDLDTDEVILEGKPNTRTLEAACAALTA